MYASPARHLVVVVGGRHCCLGLRGVERSVCLSVCLCPGTDNAGLSVCLSVCARAPITPRTRQIASLASRGAYYSEFNGRRIARRGGAAVAEWNGDRAIESGPDIGRLHLVATGPPRDVLGDRKQGEQRREGFLTNAVILRRIHAIIYTRRNVIDNKQLSSCPL